MFSRYNAITLWWNDTHKPTVYCVLCLIASGLLAIFSASYNIGDTLNVSDLYFFKKQIFFLTIAFIIFLWLSFQSVEKILQISLMGVAIAIFMMMAVLAFSGKTVKGSERWLDLKVITLQPSELLKPFFIVVTAYLYYMFEKTKRFLFPILQFALYVFVATLLCVQPDFGMALTYTFITFVQVFFSKIKIKIVLCFTAPLLVIGVIIALSLSHVKTRVIQFFKGEKVYQTHLAYTAIKNGGALGLGIGNGKVAKKIPDSHNDFIFSRIGEEMGAFYLLVIVIIFAILILSNIAYAKNEYMLYENLQNNSNAVAKHQQEMVMGYYIIMLISALIFFEMAVNISVNLSLIPAKGMALPFISYGGSSIIAHAFLIGFLCVVNRRKYRFFTW